MRLFAMMAEVMDKELSLPAVLALFLGIAAVGYLLTRFRRWLLPVPLLAAGFFAWGQVGELRDPFVGPAIRAEAGMDYVILSYSVMLIAIALPLLGAAHGRRRSN